MIRLMLAAAAGLLLVAPAAHAQPANRKITRKANKKITRKARAKKNRPKKATAGNKAGRSAANALAAMCPATIKCKVGDSRDVVLNKVSGPAKQSDGRLGCRYETPGMVQVATRRSRCRDVVVSNRACTGYNKRLVSARRTWVSTTGNTPRSGKCPIKPHVRLSTK